MASARRRYLTRREQPGRGRNAEGPSEVPAKGWKDILWRLVAEFNEDRLMLVAAGATFYLLLALFPAMSAFVSVYGFVADPQTVADHIAFLGGLLPSGGVDLIETQLAALSEQDESALSIGFLVGLAIALWSANSGIKTLFDAMNIVYEEDEKRGFVKLNLLSLAFTLAAMCVGILMIAAVGVVPALLALLNLGAWTETLISLLRWPVLLVAVALAISMIYRFGPSRSKAKWRWISWGSCLATLVWVAASIAFSFYLENFADYNATYGTLGAVIGFMMWLWISVLVVLVGAELDAELEHQTSRDTTTGPDEPMGERGAQMADEVGKAQ